MRQQFEIIQNQKQKFSSKLVPSMEILSLSQHELESLVDTSLMENPFSDIEQNQITLETKDVDPDYRKVRKKQEDQHEFEAADEQQNELAEHVMPQLYPYIKTKRDEEIFTVLLESLDSRGFLAEAEEDLCRFLNIKKDRLNRYLNIMKHIDPAGLAAKDTRECILVQLSQMEGSALAQRIVESYLEAISVKDYNKIARLEHTTAAQVEDALALIQSLNPIPANGFKVHEKPMFIVPDVYIRKEDTTVIMEMNSRIQDKLKMNTENYELYKSSVYNEEAKAFLKEKLNDFKWLQYSVSRRAVTVKKIITFLVDYQMAFFLTGDERKLRPLRLVDIAEHLHMHYSTISRAISNKFFQCVYGTYSFHFLIPRCYEKQGEVTASIDTLKNEIKEIISAENKESPYSDEKIHQLLEEDGFVISRRSVTLYRKECCIPSSRNRKISHK